MKKAISILLIFLFVFALVSCEQAEQPKEQKEIEYTVRFMSNCAENEIDLSSNYEAVGANIMVTSQSVKAGEKLTVPTQVPTRTGYDFVGWTLTKDGDDLWNFDSATVTKNLTLFAKWTRSQESEQDEFTEVELTFTEVVDDTINGISIEGVLNMPISDNSVNLTTIGLRILNENKGNVKEYLNYKINSNSQITSATFENNVITIVCNNNGTSETKTISVVDVTSTLKVVSSTYENKALKYEQNTSVEPYNIVMGGSSSMENWSTSVSDMSPLTTVNVGIGGTTVEQWTNCLAKRLIYPFSPRAVILYVGINNIINSGNTGTETGNMLKELFDDIHAHLPNTTIYFILINYVPGYLKYSSHITEANNIVKEYANGKDYMQLIDAGTNLIKESGIPNDAYFLTDGLHMSKVGYVIWGGEVKKSVIAHEKELYQ